MKLSDQNAFDIAKLSSIPKFPSNHPSVALRSDPFTSQATFHHTHPAPQIFPFHTKITSFHTPNLPPILLSHPSSFHSPHPDSVSHMGYTRPPLRPHGSHCTRIPGWIPPPGPVLDASPGNSRESSHAQGLRSDSYPPNTHIILYS